MAMHASAHQSWGGRESAFGSGEREGHHMENQWSRRHFVGTIFVLPMGTFLVRCSSSSDGGSTAPPQRSGSQITYTSSNVEGHSHTFALQTAAFETPPEGGVSGSTSSDSGHSHTVSVSASELQSIGAGQSVSRTTSEVSGHTHVFQFMKV